ncbi:MAG: HEAT repeat domain-containing protein [Planctomycetota bacterium]|nr:HEAT repeat domain-containing protein [Planctomycetota bacterium]
MNLARSRTSLTALVFLAGLQTLGAEQPQLLDSQFNLPPGFHIYKAADRSLTGGSYDLVLDGEGRLLVGDGNAVRRLEDTDGDQVYDTSKVIATGLGGRGPQGLVVYGDHLYAVGGDGVQLYSGYKAGGSLKRERRLGKRFNTGGDHAAHTLLRGLDGYVYMVSGDGGGIGERRHITEKSSPVIYERTASVFRFDPTGKTWECVGAGGRNPPSLGMNYLGEFFSFDSDMEWHVDLPWYRPVRLNHWATGSDQGWQGVGAYPSYYLDCLPGVLNVGRGSPNWGIFYEHTQFPEKYRDAFIACDYLWKSATSGGYANPGRLCAFELDRDGATWKAKMTVFAQAKQGAKDHKGGRINFALVDVDVAPDGSILLTDHNQGVWRIFYDPAEKPAIKPISPAAGPAEATIDGLLALPQPMSEWCRLREEAARKKIGAGINDKLRAAALDKGRKTRQRLRAIRLLSPGFKTLSAAFINSLAADSAIEVRAQAAWLIGIRGDLKEVPMALELLEDKAPFVRRRAAEALSRFGTESASGKLISRLDDEDRFVRYAAMTALAHRPTKEFIQDALQHKSARVWMRALVSGNIRRESPEAPHVQEVVERLLAKPPAQKEDRLDFLRVLNLFKTQVAENKELAARVTPYLLTGYPDADSEIRWEQARVLSAYQDPAAFAPLLAMLETEKDPVTQFHLARMMANIPSGWNDQESARFANWLSTTQRGWFSQFQGKGRQFKGFWGTVLNQIAQRHADGLGGLADRVVPGSQLSGHILASIRNSKQAGPILVRLYNNAKDEAGRKSVLELLKQASHPSIGKLLLSKYKAAAEPAKKDSLLAALCSQPLPAGEEGIFITGLFGKNADLVEQCANRVARDGKTIDQYAAVVSTISSGKRKGAPAVYHQVLDTMSRNPARAHSFGALLVSLAGKTPPTHGSVPKCIWTSTKQGNERAWFSKKFNLDEVPAKATLHITCDNVFTAWLNGRKVTSSSNWNAVKRMKVRPALKKGENLITVEGANQGGPGGLMAVLELSDSSGGALGMIATNETWLATQSPPAEWKTKGSAAGGNWRPPIDVSGPTANVTNLFARFLPGKGVSLVNSIAAMEFWQAWYLDEFNEPFVPPAPVKQNLKSADQVRALIAGTKKIEGNATNGRLAYLKAGCFACHGGIKNKETTIFGPPLAGVTQRLNREELADSLAFPSKAVAERFRAMQVVTSKGQVLSGFITENSDTHVTITDIKNKIHRIPKKEVRDLREQKTSLMPADLLGPLSDQEIRDLLTFLQEMK